MEGWTCRARRYSCSEALPDSRGHPWVKMNAEQELLSRRARYMTLEACQVKMNIRYGKAFGPLERLSF